MQPLSKEQLEWAIANRDKVLEDIDHANASESLIGYIRYMWPILEPGRTFSEGWAVHAICDHLQAVTDGHIKKLLINVPPGCMKSLTTDVFWPSYEWGPMKRPWNRYISASYSANLTIRDNRRMRQLIQSPRYQAAWGDTVSLSHDEANKVKFSNAQTGFKLATSVGGYVMGERGDRVIVDDPNNTKEVESQAALEEALQWITEVLPTRVNDATKSAIVIIMQRTHERDVSGHILENELGYEHLMLPMEYEPERKCFTSATVQQDVVYDGKVALQKGDTWSDPRTVDGDLLWPERFPREYLEGDLKPTLRSWGGSYAEAGQLQQRPAPRGGGMFQEDDFQYLNERPDNIIRWCRGWDLASSKDGHAAWTVGLLMGITSDKRIVIADIKRGQWSPGEVDANILRCAKEDGYGIEISIPQDPGQAGKHQVTSFAKLLMGYKAFFSPESGAKEDRARPLASQAEGQNLYLVKGKWNNTFIREATVFPVGKWVDQVDAGSRAYAHLIRRRSPGAGSGPVVIGG